MIRRILSKNTTQLPLFSSSSSSHTIEPTIEPYLTYRSKELQQYRENLGKTVLEGFYNEQGMQGYEKIHPQIEKKMLNSVNGLKISGLGIGTYKGSEDQSDDILQFNGIVDSVLSGVNVIDTCSNFRAGRSESVIGAALRYLVREKKYARNSIFLQSKAGYISERLPPKPSSEVINGHCVDPDFLSASLDGSLQNIGVKTLDVFYLNNFSECQLQTLQQPKFDQKLMKSFQFMEEARRNGKIKNYGLSSWQSFRCLPTHPAYLSLRDIVKLAEKVGGKDHGFKFLQIPINLMMPESFADKNQDGGSLLEAAEELKINVVSNSPLLSGSLINIPLPSDKLNCRHNGAKHLQIIRSIPSNALVCTLVGQKTNRHVKKNLQVLTVNSLSPEEWFNFFIPQEEPNSIES